MTEQSTLTEQHPRRGEPPEGSPVSAAARVAAGLVIVLVLVAGIFLLGRLAATDTMAVIYTTVWFGVVLLAGLLMARRERALVLPLAVGYGVTAVAAGVLLGLPMFTDRTVDEEVVVGAPAAPAPAVSPAPADAAAAEPPAPADAEAPAPADPAAEPAPEPEPAPPAGPIELARGSFVPLDHPGVGTAAVVQLPEGNSVLTFTEFQTDNGPDLRVYLTTQDPAATGQIGEFVDLGVLKGNVGDQQYDIPADVDPAQFPHVVVWCRAFSSPFVSAALPFPR